MRPVTATALCLLASCLGPRADSSRYFTLPPAGAPAAGPATLTVGLGPVTLPPWLSRPEIAIRDAARSLEKEVPGVAGDARGAMQRLTAALDQLDATLREVKLSLAPDAPVPAQLERTLREVGQAARSLRILADSLERDPSQIVRGRPEGSR